METTVDTAQEHTKVDQVIAAVKQAIIGQDKVIEEVLITLVAGGHALLEGVPGLGKRCWLALCQKRWTCSSDEFSLRPT